MMIRFSPVLILLAISFGVAQNLVPTVTLDKQPLLILPAEGGDDPESIEAKVTAIVASKAAELKRFEVVDRNHLEKILEEQAIQMSGIVNDSNLVELGKIAAAPEALIIRVINFGQKGVPPESEEEEDQKDRKEARKAGLFGIIAKGIADAVIAKSTEDVERYPNNIQTVIHAEVQKINVETGQSLASFTLLASPTGGNKKASLSNALSQIGWQVSSKLRELYLLTSEVLDVRGNEVMLLLGQDMGVRVGTVFEITSPEQKRVLQNREITIPGRPVGMVQVTEISPDANRSWVLRKWALIEPGYRAVEHTSGIGGASMQLSYAPETQAFQFQGRGIFTPLRKAGGEIGLGLGTIQDSRKDSDFMFGLGLILNYKFIHTSPFSLAGTVTLPLQLAFRSDDKSHTVTLPIFSPRIGAQVLIMLSPKRDLVVSLDYAFSSTTSNNWKYTKENDDDETDTFNAEWTHDPVPKIDAKGLYLSIGLRFLSFDTGFSKTDRPGFTGFFNR